jgi:hypothetical protein
MYLNREEFLLLSRRGSVPPAIRAGPRHPEYDLAASLDELRPRPWVLRSMAAALGGMLRHAPRSDGGAGAADQVDRAAYLELEFAVGFGFEDEPRP